MKRKQALIVALVLAVLGVVVLHVYTSKVKKRYVGEENIVWILVAKKDISAGSPIKKDSLGKKQYHKDFLTHDLIEVKDIDEVIGLIPKREIKSGTPIMRYFFEEEVALTLEPTIFSSHIVKGERAITISVDRESSVSNLIRPGDRVDIIGTFLDLSTREMKTITLLQNVPVLATGKDFGAGYKGGERKEYSTITLAVTPFESELLTFARKKGDITFTLRGPDDFETLKDIPEADYSKIFGKDLRNELQKKRDAWNRERSTRIKILK